MADSLEGWNLLLLTLDTTRADRLGCYGYGPARTPVLDGLAAAGTRFTNATVQAPMTLPSHTTIFTGNNPTYHGVRHNGLHALPEAQFTLAEILRGSGYQTAAVVAAAVLDGRYGLRQGFDRFDDSQRGSGSQFLYAQRTGPEVTEAALAAVADFDKSRPYFLWAHYFDPHFEYEPPEEFARHFPNTASGRYDGEIATMDHAIGTLLQGLRKTGRMKRTLVMVIADHGEGIDGPHEEWTHGIFLYRDTLEVPFLVSAEGGLPRGRTVDALVTGTDVTPTALDLLGVKHGGVMQGRSLAKLLRDESAGAETDPPSDPIPDEPRYAYAEATAPFHQYGWSPLAQIRDERWKLVWGPSVELYDLASDRDELSNIASEHPDKVETLKRKIREIDAVAHTSDARLDAAPSSQEQQRLRRLGYVVEGGGQEIPSLDERAGLGDPMKLMRLQEPLAQARRLQAEGRAREALALVQQDVLAVDPGNLDGLLLVGQFATELASWSVSTQAYERLIGLRPGSFSYRWKLADMRIAQATRAKQQGQADLAGALTRKAIGEYEAIIAEGCADAIPFVNLGRVYILQANLEAFKKAEPLLTRAIQIDSNNFEAHLNLGLLYEATRHFDRSLELLDRAIELSSPGTPRYDTAVRVRGRVQSKRG